MKFVKILALVLSVCMLGSMLLACDKGGDAEETTAAVESVSINVNLIIKNGSTTVDEETIKYDGKAPTLGNVIELYCVGEYEDYADDAFDANTGLLTKIGDLAATGGKNWIAYYEKEGENKAFASIKNQTLADGDTVVLVLK